MSDLKITDLKNTLIPGSTWSTTNKLKGYEKNEGNELATELIIGRKFEIIENPILDSLDLNQSRLRVQLLEDGYQCWLQIQHIFNQIESSKGWKPKKFTRSQIYEKLPKIINWIEKSSKLSNHYVWGGTAGPNFDCSGLVQRAFSIESIWLPRDAYQQEKFCTPINFNQNDLKELIPGDLLFFGTSKKCSHVAVYRGNAEYWHSSGIENGRDGIGIDTLKPTNNNDISSYYLSILRGAGRVEYCHDGSFIA